MIKRRVLLHVVTFEHREVIPYCVKALCKIHQEAPQGSIEILITDNASQDGTFECLVEFCKGTSITVLQNSENLGFCGAHNQAAYKVLQEGFDFLLILNPDLTIDLSSIRTMIETVDKDSTVGMATPKILRATEELTPIYPPIIDSTGIVWTSDLRHLDRGAGELDSGQYNLEQYVEGATGACMLLTRHCIEKVSFRTPLDRELGKIVASSLEKGQEYRTQLFDEAFFAYREDADLSWRISLLGYSCLYIPRAVAYHVRRVLPERRSSLPSRLNSWSVRNRFLLQGNNLFLRNDARFVVQGVLLRNFLVIAGVFLKEQSSIVGLREAIRLLPRALERRKEIKRRRQYGI